MVHSWKTFLLVLFLFAAPSSADDSWLYSDTATLHLSVTGALNAYKTADTYVFDSLKVNLTLFPKDTERQVVFPRFSPAPISQTENEVVFSTSAIGETTFGYTAKIVTSNSVRKVAAKIPFPAKAPSELKEYTQPAYRIDSNNIEIIKAASQLAEGEDDYFLVVDRISDFVNREVNYNLSTLFIKGSKDASWVLANKKGVCSEISVLFIAMLRSLGIPARFVSGVSYTNSPLFDYNFGPHAWAEVYFPGVGWVPYDITYGQFGYIDLGHIEMRKSADASETSTTYQWRAKNVEVESSELKIDGAILERSERRVPDIRISAKPYYGRVGFLSYNIMLAEIENPNDYYVSKRIKLGKTQDLENFGSEFQVALAPKEKKNLQFIVRTPNLDPKYYYTFPITIYTEQNETARTEFLSGSGWQRISEEDMLSITSSLKERPKKTYSKRVSFSCFTRDYYSDELITLRCDLANLGNVYFSDLSVCVDRECLAQDLGIGQTMLLNFSLSRETPGPNRVPIRISAKDLSQSDILELNILDIPNVRIIDTSLPLNISFEDEVPVSFTIERGSKSEPKNIAARIIVNGNPRRLNIDELKDRFEIKTRVRGSELSERSAIEFEVTYEDNLGRKYSAGTEEEIALNPLTLKQRARIFWNSIEGFLNRVVARVVE